MNLEKAYVSLRKASEKLALQKADKKNKALAVVADALDKNRAVILAANKEERRPRKRLERINS